MRVEVRVSGPATRDIAAILARSRDEFGDTAATRYAALIAQALNDIGENPKRPGSIERPEIMIDGARTYHLEYSRTRVKGQRVKSPRHFLLYRWVGESVVEVARILHDARDLPRHVPEQYRRMDDGE